MAKQRKQAAQRARAVRQPVRPVASRAFDPHVEIALARGASPEQVLAIAKMSDPLYALEIVAREMRYAEVRRRDLLSDRDALVEQLRASGMTWHEVAALAGVSHAALIERRRR